MLTRARSNFLLKNRVLGVERGFLSLISYNLVQTQKARLLSVGWACLFRYLLEQSGHLQESGASSCHLPSLWLADGLPVIRAWYVGKSECEIGVIQWRRGSHTPTP